MSERRAQGRRNPPRRTLLVFLLVSVAAHAAALVALTPPEFRKGPSRSGALEVVILAATPLPLETREPVVAPRAESGTQPMPARSVTSNVPRLAAREPVIALRDPDEGHAAPVASEPLIPPSTAVSERDAGPTTAAEAPPRVNAAYLSNPAPRYPDAARRTGDQGTVTLRVHVTRDGTASRVAVEKSSGSPHLDAAALEAVRAWRFAPARRGGEAIESWMLVPIVFRLEQPS